MKIAFINYYQNKVSRGSETFVKEISARLGPVAKIDVISGEGKIIKRWPALWRLFIDPQGLTILFFTLKNIGRLAKAKYDVIVPLNGGWQPAIIRILAWIMGTKMLITGHSGIGWDDLNNLWCFPDYFVALSTSAFNWARKANSLVKTVYIPNGVDLKKFNPNGGKYPINLPRPIILCVGALTPDKRIDLVIKAVAQLKSSSLLVVGEGELRGKLEALGTRLLGPRFKIMKLQYEQMPEIYRVADVFTLASTVSHSFEIVLIEAMASGLPVVANCDPIRQEIVGDAGLFVNPEDITEYTEVIKKALKENWGEKPRRQAEKFDWESVAGQYRMLLNKL
jgi:glycosyltransferase involved in cell wall biosynthesis